MHAQHISNLSRSLPPTPSQLHPYANDSDDDDDDDNENGINGGSRLGHGHTLPEDYFGEPEEVPLPFPIKTIVADPQTGLSLTLISALGAGSYAVVYLAKEITSGSLYALKCLGKDKLTEEEVAVQRNEVVIHTSLPKHRNIIHLFNMFETTNHLFLLLEYSSGMDMYQWISMRSDRTDPVSGESHTAFARFSVIKSIFDQVLEGVSQVHLCGVAHRDLKPENFLIEHVDGEYTVKITDFGLATTDMDSDEFECGSKPYMSYECRNGDTPYNVQMADIWSLGIILINLLYHRCPWSDPCPDESFAFSSFLCNRVDFLQRRFEDMPGPVARWLGLRAFAFVEPRKKANRKARPTMAEWRQWMEGFVPRMLGQMDIALDSDGLGEDGVDEDEDDLLGQEVEGDEIFESEDDESQDHVVPIAIHMSSSMHRDQSRHFPRHQLEVKAPFSGSIPKFDPSAFYQPARLRQESWSDAIDMEGTEDAEMDFTAPILFEESGEEDNQDSHRHDHDNQGDDDETGLAMALPDDFIEEISHSTTPEARLSNDGAVPHLKFSRQPDLRFELDSANLRNNQERASPGFEKQDTMNTLVFIEPDVTRARQDTGLAGSGNLASSLPSTSHMALQMSSQPDEAAKEQQERHLKHRMKKPVRDLQEVKAAPFVFPPLKTPTSSGFATSDIQQSQKDSTTKLFETNSQSHATQSQSQGSGHGGATQTNVTAKPGASSFMPRVPPSQRMEGHNLGPSARGAISGVYHNGNGGSFSGNNSSWGASNRHHQSTPSANWRKTHHRGGSWTSIDEPRDSRRKQQDGGYSRIPKNERQHHQQQGSQDYRDEGSMGLPPRVENKFRPRYRQNRRPNNGNNYHNNGHQNFGNGNTFNAALPPAPPMPLNFGGGGGGGGGPTRSRHQSRSGTVFDAPMSSQQSTIMEATGQRQQQQQLGLKAGGSSSGYKREAQPFSGSIKYENSQLRMSASKSSSGQPGSHHQLKSQRNKSLVDLRALDATSQPWRQQSNPQPLPLTATTTRQEQEASAAMVSASLTTTTTKYGSTTDGISIEDRQSTGGVAQRRIERAQVGDQGTPKDNVYHPPQWYERRSSHANTALGGGVGLSRRPPSGTEMDFSGWQKHDGSNLLAFPPKNKSGSKGRTALSQVLVGGGGGGGGPTSQGQGQDLGHQSQGAGQESSQGLGQGNTAPTNSPFSTMGSSPLERKKHQQRSTGSLSSNWRGGGGGSSDLNGSDSNNTNISDSASATTPVNTTLSPSVTSGSLRSLNASISSTVTESPLMTLTPPTPNVENKDFLGANKVHHEGANLEITPTSPTTTTPATTAPKSIVQPGAMQGLGNMLRGLVAYNKNIKVAGEHIDVTAATSPSASTVSRDDSTKDK